MLVGKIGVRCTFDGIFIRSQRDRSGYLPDLRH